MSKTTFYQIFECISLKVLDTGSLQIFANPCKFASQLCQKKCLSIFLVKWVYHKHVYFYFIKYNMERTPSKFVVHSRICTSGVLYLFVIYLSNKSKLFSLYSKIFLISPSSMFFSYKQMIGPRSRKNIGIRRNPDPPHLHLTDVYVK